MSGWAVVETIALMVLCAAARDQVIACRLLGLDAPAGYFYVMGAVVAGADGWLPGLWDNGGDSCGRCGE